MGMSVQLKAFAKINLSLEITGKRPDGFHSLVSVMQEVSLCDTLELSDANDVTLDVDGAETGPQEDNLVFRAALALRPPGRGAHARLIKGIPVGGGLGGGSSDAAVALVGLNRLWNLGLACAELAEQAELLGSDVPFFLTGGTALIRGRGELVRQLTLTSPTWYVLLNPGFHVSTARVFGALSSDQWRDGSVTEQLARDLDSQGQSRIGVNTLQSTLFDLYPEAERCFRSAERLAPHRTIVSGSGPTVVSLFETQSAAASAAQGLSSLGYWTRVVRNCPTEGRDLPCRE
jgi:4-diphosphocytidyl-2-C-methyl-D-erythritol kinase